jgi:hypothetical protein
MGIFQHTKAKEWKGESVKGREKARDNAETRRARKDAERKKLRTGAGRKDRLGWGEYGAGSVAWGVRTVDDIPGYF